ncbi:MAG: NADP-dependent oxidoreductase [Deltaproteobacteria bacterium]|nr:NADP-dependent oxidoreductase [Deltaproteobacteria bacterium]MBW2448739.1 NADP-dependent oxidoreductase [Deltaproteobacteria bacterium]
MSDRVNRQWLLARRPQGMVSPADFEFVERPIPELAEGEYLVRNLYISFDPTMRGWMEDRESYMPPVALGDVMRCSTVGQVTESKNPAYARGTILTGLFGMQELAVGGQGFMHGTPVAEGTPLTWPLGVTGLTGMTAYFGMLELGEPKPGETVLVSGAAGATGSVAAQIAKLEGCRVVGIAGGPEKCAWLEKEAGLDAAIDYKSENVEERIRALCPDGVDIYFDNVAGPILDAALANLALRARVVMCGGISGYNEEKPPPGPQNLMNVIIQRARMEGFIIIDYVSRFPEAAAALTQWVREGKIVHQEDVQVGIENAPETFVRLFTGQNLGKQLLKVGDPVDL